MNDPVSDFPEIYGEWNHTCTVQCPIPCPASSSEVSQEPAVMELVTV